MVNRIRQATQSAKIVSSKVVRATDVAAQIKSTTNTTISTTQNSTLNVQNIISGAKVTAETVKTQDTSALGQLQNIQGITSGIGKNILSGNVSGAVGSLAQQLAGPKLVAAAAVITSIKGKLSSAANTARAISSLGENIAESITSAIESIRAKASDIRSAVSDIDLSDSQKKLRDRASSKFKSFAERLKEQTMTLTEPVSDIVSSPGLVACFASSPYGNPAPSIGIGDEVRVTRPGNARTTVEQAERDTVNEPSPDDDQGRLAATQSRRTTTSSPTGGQEPTEEEEEYLNAVFNNPLDDYMLPKYNIQLSMVDLRGYKDRKPVLHHAELLKAPVKVVGFSGTTIKNNDGDLAPDDKYYHITKMSMKQFMGPTEINPTTISIAELKLTLKEILGFSFDRTINKIGYDLGYNKVSTSRIIYRIDVWFGGWKKNGAYEEQINFDYPFSVDGKALNNKKFTMFMVLSRIDSDHTGGVTTVECNFMPVSQTAMLSANEIFALPAGDIPTDLTTGELTVQNAVNSFANYLNAKIGQIYVRPGIANNPISESSTARNIKHFQYFITVHPDMANQVISRPAPKDSTEWTTTFGDNVPTVLQNMIKQTDQAKADLENYPKRLWTIRTEIRYGNDESEDTKFINDYTHIAVKITIEPYIDFRYVAATPEEVKDPNGERLLKVLNYRALRRVYFYGIYNTEVMNFDIKLNKYYFHTIANPYQETGTGGLDSSATTEDQKKLYSSAKPFEQPNGSVGERNRMALRQLVDNVGTGPAPTQQENDRTGWSSAVRRSQNSAASPAGTSGSGSGGNISSVEDSQKSYDAQFANLLVADLLKLDGFEVRGDPRWLFSYDTMSTPNQNVETPLATGVLKSSIIMLKSQTLDSTEYMKNSGLQQPMKIENDLTGFYQIISVEHFFEDGQFRQTFDGVRLPLSTIDASVTATDRATGVN